MDGIGQQGDAARKHDDDHLDQGCGHQPDERPFQRPETPARRRDGRIDHAVGMPVMRGPRTMLARCVLVKLVAMAMCVRVLVVHTPCQYTLRWSNRPELKRDFLSTKPRSVRPYDLPRWSEVDATDGSASSRSAGRAAKPLFSLTVAKAPEESSRTSDRARTASPAPRD